MSNINRVVLVGNLTKDVDSRYTPQGVSVAQTGIAVNRYTKNESGDYDVDFFNLVAFRGTADYMSQYLKKGNRVAIEGRLQSRSWDDAATGQKRTVYEIVVDNVMNLTPRRDGDEESAPRAVSSIPNPPVDEDMDEADPFADEPAVPVQPEPRARRAAAVN